MKTIKTLSFILGISLFFGCFSPLTNDNTFISISIGNGSSGAIASAWPPTNHDFVFNSIRHEISITGPGKPASATLRGGEGTLDIPVDRPGTWNVNIKAYLEDLLYAEGNKSVLVRSGMDNQADVYMDPSDIIFFIVRDAGDWNAARNGVYYLNFDGYTKFAIIVAQSFPLAGLLSPVSGTNNTFHDTDIIEVHIRGNHTITLDDNPINGSLGSLLRVGENQTVIVRDTKFNGNDVENNTTLIQVAGTNSHLIFRGSASIHSNKSPPGNNGGGGINVDSAGTFIMQENSSVHSNLINGNGGGVNVTNNGTFIMHNGRIYDNEAVQLILGNGGNGGGVSIRLGGFEMTGGSIYENTAAVNGGGVSLDSPATSITFTLHNGRIYGNEAIQGHGGGVYVGIGAFQITGGIVYGNDAQPPDLANNVDPMYTGASLHVTDMNPNNSAQYGSMVNGEFAQAVDGNNGDILPWPRDALSPTNYTNDTFRVVNGELLPLQ